MSERPEDESLVTDAYADAATKKIAALWESIGFEHFSEGVYLRDTALEHGGELRRCRKELAALGEEYRSARR
ncbi:hypothetical protein [Streptomyces sp. NPDC051909]|uniref:hypothetical protein n=1 Tax=Streptomyces sp. NPDC051909 TaxID=3154944 RepID=UPI00343564DC